jgi:hypothetical protein
MHNEENKAKADVLINKTEVQFALLPLGSYLCLFK